MRIFTGAALPEGANAVIMQEHVERIGSNIVVQKPVRPRENVRSRGEDLRRGSLALNSGERLSAASLGLVHFLDRVRVTVARSPVVSIVATGSELRAPGSAARPGSIVESNSPMIAALTTQVGATVLGCTRVDDDAEAIERAIEGGLETSDVLVTIGGVSVGDYDLVKPALLASGVELTLHHVSIKPGKPITLGRRKNQVVIGLPGNPASAVLTYALFALPLLRKMQGDRKPYPTPVLVPATTSMKRDPKRTRIVLGNLEGTRATCGFVPHPNQSSGAMTALAQSTAMVLLSSGERPVEVGELVPFLRWTDL
jgi:molybdopterin molybdotransferase